MHNVKTKTAMNGNANISTELLSAVKAIKTAILQSQARAVQVRSGGQTVTGFGGSDPNALYLPLITDGLYEAYYTTKDKKEKDVEVVAGQLNVVSYTQQSINVCLVGVNGTRYQNSISELAAYLNKVFGQAVTTINLTTASIEVDKFNGTLSAKESGALSAYNSDMKKLIRKVKKLPDYNSETYYIMLVAKSDNPALGGFMPVNSNFGFVFAQANSGAGQMNRTIAHELAHGAFRLWHTFSGENLYTAPQGTTNNLMDYNGTNAELYKYQWDYIHNPQGGIVRWLVDEDEGEAKSDSIVIVVTETDKTNYGFDVIESSSENYISVANGDATTFRVTSNSNDLFFVINGNAVHEFSLKIDTLPSNNAFDITIRSLNNSSNTTNCKFQIRLDSINGTIKKEIQIISYPIVTTDIKLLKLDCKNLCISRSSLQKLLDQGVISLSSFICDSVNIKFDINNNGALDWFRAGDNPEFEIIKNSIGENTENTMVIIDVPIHMSVRLKQPIKKGSSYFVAEFNDTKLVAGRILHISTDFIDERVTIKEVINDTIYVNGEIENDFSINDLVWREISGLSSNPQLIKTGSSKLPPSVVYSTIVHERLHKQPFGLTDLSGETQNMDNIMLYKTAENKKKLRNRPLNIYGGTRTEKQWDKIKRNVK